MASGRQRDVMRDIVRLSVTQRSRVQYIHCFFFSCLKMGRNINCIFLNKIIHSALRDFYQRIEQMIKDESNSIIYEANKNNKKQYYIKPVISTFYGK